MWQRFFSLGGENAKNEKMTFSERQRRRRAGELSVEESSNPVLPFSMHNVKEKVTFSERQRLRKQGQVESGGLKHRIKEKVTFSEHQRARRRRERQKLTRQSLHEAVSDAGDAGGVLDSPESPSSPASCSIPSSPITPTRPCSSSPSPSSSSYSPPSSSSSSSSSSASSSFQTPISAPHKLSKAQWQVRLKAGPMTKRLLSGAFAGTISRTAVAPLETIRTHLMVGNGAGKSVPEVFVHIMKTEGWKGLFRGNGINVIRVAPSKAVELFMFDTMKKSLTAPEGQKPYLPVPVAPVAGAMAGMTSTICTYPLELLKTRLTVQRGVYKSIPDAIVRIVREEGFWELYRGLVPSVIGVAPYAASNYYAYDTLKNVHKRVTKRQRPEPFETLIMGSLSGAFASTLTFPLEVARKQMQVGALEGRVVYRSTTHAIRSILHDQGVKGLYRGLGASCIKLMPAAGISFMCYEFFKQALLEERVAEEEDNQQTQTQQQQQKEQ